MEILKNLYKEQQKALKNNDMWQLNEINKKIFAIREELRKQKILTKQKQNDDEIDKRINEILSK